MRRGTTQGELRGPFMCVLMDLIWRNGCATEGGMFSCDDMEYGVEVGNDDTEGCAGLRGPET